MHAPCGRQGACVIEGQGQSRSRPRLLQLQAAAWSTFTAADRVPDLSGRDVARKRFQVLHSQTALWHALAAAERMASPVHAATAQEGNIKSCSCSRKDDSISSKTLQGWSELQLQCAALRGLPGGITPMAAGRCRRDHVCHSQGCRIRLPLPLSSWLCQRRLTQPGCRNVLQGACHMPALCK